MFWCFLFQVLISTPFSPYQNFSGASGEAFLHCWHIDCSRVTRNIFVYLLLNSLTEVFLQHCQFAASDFKLLSFPLEPSRSFSYFSLVLLLTYLVQSAELQPFLSASATADIESLDLWKNTYFCHLSHIWLTKDGCVNLCYHCCKPVKNLFFFPFK